MTHISDEDYKQMMERDCGSCQKNHDGWCDYFNELIAKVFDYSPWHTGTPTEEGWYLQCNMANNKIFYDTDYYENGDWKYCCILRNILAWQKIEPFKEEDDKK